MYHKLFPVIFAAFALASCKKGDTVATEKSTSGTYIGTTHLIIESQFGSDHYYLDSTYTDSVAVIHVPGDSIAIHNFQVNNSVPYYFQWAADPGNNYYASGPGSHSVYWFHLYPQVDSLHTEHSDGGGIGGSFTHINANFEGIKK